MWPNIATYFRSQISWGCSQQWYTVVQTHTSLVISIFEEGHWLLVKNRGRDIRLAWLYQMNRGKIAADAGHILLPGRSIIQHFGAYHGPLTRYVKLRVAHAPGMPRTFSTPQHQRKPLVNDPGMHHGTCVMRVPWCMSGSLTRGGEENIPGACVTHSFT